MINWLRRVFLSSIYRKTIKQNSAVHKKESSKKLNIISVILDHRLGINKEHFKKIGSHFNIPRKNVRVLTFFQSQKQINELNNGSSFTSKNISNLGVLNGVLVEFCKEKTDVLINFYDRDDINLKYLSAKSNKKLSIGFKSVDHALNDLILEVDAKNIDVFVSECIKYLEIFFNNKK
tara:strand:- start:125 stop:655 length:531 start_codon:yes stop_codon:yes gene_type:complete